MATTTEQMLKEIADELFSIFESMETQNGAIALLLREKDIVSDKELAPFLQQSDDASSVKWRAARVRFDHLLSSIARNIEENARKEAAKPAKEQPDERGKVVTEKKPPEKPSEESAEISAPSDSATQEKAPEKSPEQTPTANKKDHAGPPKRENESQTVTEDGREQQKDHAA
jgi:outer membrane biosynthesis protein TonB